MKPKSLTLILLFIASFASSQLNFSQHHIDYGQSYTVRELLNADLNNDGKIDIVSISDVNTISWFQNLGGGLFSFMKIITTTEDNLRDIATGDPDSDGDLDVFYAAANSNTVGWYENLGNGTFSTVPMIIDHALSGATTVNIDDVNEDGLPDLIATSQLSNLIVWYKNLGNNAFSIKNEISGFTGPNKVRMGDINNDGKLDLLVSGVSYHLTAFLRTGPGTYNFAVIIGSSSPIVDETLLMDIDGDNDLDAVVVRSIGTRIYKYNGNGFAVNPINLEANTSITAMAAGDIDLDGDQDLVIGRSFNNTIALAYFSNPVGGYTGTTGSPTLSNLSDDIRSIQIADYDQDGRPDIMAGLPNADRIIWFKNPPVFNNLWSYKEITTNVRSLQTVYFEDMDNDGDLDVVSFNHESCTRADCQRISWYENLGGGEFSRQKVILMKGVVTDMSVFDVVDIDGDGKKDLTIKDLTSGYTHWIKNNGSGNFSLYPVTISGYDFGSNEFGDLDGDGDEDIIGISNSLDLQWTKNNGNGTFQTLPMIIDQSAAVGPLTQVSLWDIDADGDLDVVTAGNNAIRGYLNNGTGTFSSAFSLVTSVLARNVIMTDIDEDNVKDLLYITSTPYQVVYKKALGGGSFGSALVIDNLAGYIASITAGDFNNDTKTDLTINYDHGIYLLINQGGGIFAPREYATYVQSALGSTKMADVDSDGDKDLLHSASVESRISWNENKFNECMTKRVTINDTICSSESYLFNGNVLLYSGTYIDTIPATGSFCDSIVTLNLRVNTTGACAVASPPCSELYFSQYIHGFSTDKALEIYNPTNQPVNLTGYSIRHFNSVGTTTTGTINLTGVLPSNSVFVVSTTNSSAAILAQADMTTNVLTLDGNTAMGLFKENVLIDIIGQLNSAPIEGWGAPPNSTFLQNLVRKPTETTGYINTSGPYITSDHFTGYPANSTTDLGTHTSNCAAQLCNTPGVNTISESICAGSSYDFNGTLISFPGVYFDTLTNFSGCDSVIRLVLSVPQNYSFVSGQICPGDSYLFANQSLTVPGLYLDDSDPCEIVRLTLTNSTPVVNTITETICFGESITVNGVVYSNSVSGAVELISNGAANGCDSTIIVNLTVLPYIEGTASIQACNSYTWINGTVYNASNNTDTYLITGGAVSGCDSLVHLDLTIGQTTYATDAKTACNSYTWIDGITYTSSNSTATHTLLNASGCDSVVTLNLIINQPQHSTDIRNECSPFTWIDGVNYTTNNSTATHTLTGASSNGCDSVIHLNLTILNNQGTDVQSSCEPIVWIDGNTYSSSNNTATFVLENAEGCDSIVTLQLTLTQINKATSLSGLTISAVAVTNNTYKWMNCTTGALIPGATNQTYTATSNGDYAVIITRNGCSDTSACVTIATVGLEELSTGLGVQVFPNPANDCITLVSEEVISNVVLYNVLGGVCLKKELNRVSSDIDLSDLNSGIYLMEINTVSGKQLFRKIDVQR